MAATVLGAISFGLSAETGLFAESITFDFTAQEKWIADGDGDDVAGAVFKPEMSFTIEGALNTGGAPTWTLGSALAIANAPTYTSYISTGGSGTVVLLGVSEGLGNESEERRTLTGKYKPFVTSGG